MLLKKFPSVDMAENFNSGIGPGDCTGFVIEDTCGVLVSSIIMTLVLLPQTCPDTRNKLVSSLESTVLATVVKLGGDEDDVC